MTFKLVNINIAIFMKKNSTIVISNIIMYYGNNGFFELVLW